MMRKMLRIEPPLLAPFFSSPLLPFLDGILSLCPLGSLRLCGSFCLARLAFLFRSVTTVSSCSLTSLLGGHAGRSFFPLVLSTMFLHVRCSEELCIICPKMERKLSMKSKIVSFNWFHDPCCPHSIHAREKNLFATDVERVLARPGLQKPSPLAVRSLRL